VLKDAEAKERVAVLFLFVFFVDSGVEGYESEE
jgi:hypothetical protein